MGKRRYQHNVERYTGKMVQGKEIFQQQTSWLVSEALAVPHKKNILNPNNVLIHRVSRHVGCSPRV